MALTGSIASFNLRFITATQLDSHVSGTTSAVCRLSAAWTSGVWLASRHPDLVVAAQDDADARWHRPERDGFQVSHHRQ